MNLTEEPMTTGWPAMLALQYAWRQQRATLVKRHHIGPLRVQKPFYPEGDGVCHTVILHPPGGIVGGDSLHMEVNLLENSHALLTTPGAGKWYRSAGRQALQKLVFEAAKGAILEWLPQETIIFDGALANVRMQVRLAEGALYIGWDIVCLGRTASGEHFERGLLDQQVEVFKDGQPIWHEHYLLRGGDRLLHSPIGLAGHTVIGTMMVAGATVPESLLDQCRQVGMEGTKRARTGITQLPDIVLVRYLGDSAEQAKHYFEAAWCCLRPVLAGRSACPPRIWKT
jgi:urease accessory protein